MDETPSRPEAGRAPADLAFFAAAVGASRLPMVVTDPRRPDNPIVFANDAFLRLTGYAREEVTGRNCRFLQGAATDPHAVAAMREAIAGHREVALELLNYRKDGTPFWNAVQVCPVVAIDGTLTHFLGYQADVTERRAAEERRRQQADQQLQALSDAIPHLVWTAQPDGAIDWFNRRWYDYTGTSAEQVQGWAWACVHDPAMLPEVVRRWRASVASGEPFEMVFPLRAADGSFRPFLTRAVPLRDAAGRIVRWFGTNTEVSEFRENEARFERLVAERTRELEAANARLRAEAAARGRVEAEFRQAQKLEAVGQLTGGLAHDFNNLLTVVMGGLETIDRQLAALPDGAERGRMQRAVETSMQGARRAATLTQRLLAFARPQPLDPRPIDVNALVQGMTDMLRRTLGEGIAVGTLLAGGLWRVLADPNQLENALLNLTVNARDAMPEGGRLTVETANLRLAREEAAQEAVPVQPGDYVSVAVTDTGAGMPPETVERAFEQFFTTKQTGQGSGLGLSQVYGFVRQSNGHVRIASKPGQGTTVRILLPRLAAAPADAGQASAAVSVNNAR